MLKIFYTSKKIKFIDDLLIIKTTQIIIMGDQ